MRSAIWDLVWIAVVLIVASVFLGVMATTTSPRPGAQPITLTDLALAIRHSSIASIEIQGNQGVAVDVAGASHTFELTADTDLLRALTAFGVSPDELANVTYTVRDPPPAAAWWNALVALAPMIVLGMVAIVATSVSSENNQQLLQLTKHHATRFIATRQSIGFADVAGVDEAKRELQELVQFLATPERFADVGAQCPRGVLLVGPPGTGKTLLARAVAGEARVPFFSISGSEFVEIVAGVGASRVRDLFETARQIAPCILFVDEIDAIGRRRGLGISAGTSEGEQALNQLLVEMDGFDSTVNVIVLAATNRADTLDPALLRPGRFDRHVFVAPPDLAGRQAILEVHARGKPFDAGVDLRLIARATTGLSGADLAQIMNESAILAVRRGKSAIGMPEIHCAIERRIMGPEVRSRVVLTSVRRRRAYREAGRALTIRYLPWHPRVSRITIVPHSQTESSTQCAAAEDRVFATKAELEDQLTASLAGAAAERLAFPEIATGDKADISTATGIAEAMVKRYGMSQRLGPIALGTHVPRTYSESTARLIDEEIQSLINHAYMAAVTTLKAHRSALDTLASALLESETLEGDAIEQVLAATVS